MTAFGDLFDYTAWANESVLAVTDGMTADQLRTPMPELGGSVLELLEHTAKVEAVFLALMSDDWSLAVSSELEYPAVREAFALTAERYRQRLPHLDVRLTETFHVPWFNRDFKVEQALLQVATHSVQHRAGICAGIARAGLTAPGLDYIMWLSQFR